MLDEYYLFCEFCGEGLDENGNCPDCDDFYDDNQEYGYWMISVLVWIM